MISSSFYNFWNTDPENVEDNHWVRWLTEQKTNGCLVKLKSVQGTSVHLDPSLSTFTFIAVSAMYWEYFPTGVKTWVSPCTIVIPCTRGEKAFPAQRTWGLVNSWKAKTVFPPQQFQPAIKFCKCGNRQDTLLSAKIADACVLSPGRSEGRETRYLWWKDSRKRPQWSTSYGILHLMGNSERSTPIFLLRLVQHI